MITSFTILGYLGDSVTMELANPWASGFVINSVDGLSPPKATINTSDISTGDGAVFNSSRVGTRNIVFDLGIIQNDDGDSVETVRKLCYRLFCIKQYVYVLVQTTEKLVYTYGYVESVDVDIFSESETVQVSIICPDPYFYDAYADGANPTVLDNVLPLFKFPFSSDSVEEPSLVFGELSSNSTTIVDYRGDISTGFELEIDIESGTAGSIGDITVYKSTGEYIKLYDSKVNTATGSRLKQGDVVYIDTRKGQKGIKLVRNNATTNLLNCIDMDAPWLTLDPGENKIECYTSTSFTGVKYSITYSVMYSGV